MNRSVASRVREGVLSPCSVLVTIPLGILPPATGSSVQERCDAAGGSPGGGP